MEDQWGDVDWTAGRGRFSLFDISYGLIDLFPARDKQLVT